MGRDVRLVDSLARRRLLYPSPMLSAPSVLVIDIPPEMRTTSLPLGRYYFAILETDIERQEFEKFLSEARAQLVAPTLFDHRPPLFETDQILISRYEPPLEGWPWLLVCRWPSAHVRACPFQPDDLAGGAYSVELFADAEDMEDAIAAIIASLGDRHELGLRIIAGELLPTAGHS